jgi:hypothetical protein
VGEAEERRVFGILQKELPARIMIEVLSVQSVSSAYCFL